MKLHNDLSKVDLRILRKLAETVYQIALFPVSA